MPKKPEFSFQVRIRISEAFTLDSVVRRPRTFKPKDVVAASQNNEVVPDKEGYPRGLQAFATYLVTDFFAHAHATGLYNRQKNLWEALSKVTAIHAQQLSTGLIKKKPLPIYDLSLVDYKGKPLLYACLIDTTGNPNEELSQFKHFVSRAQRKGVTGVFCCMRSPVSSVVVDHAASLIHTLDPIAKYEAILPGTKASFDLLEMFADKIPESIVDEPLADTFRLILPELKKPGSTKASAPRKRKKKTEEIAQADQPPAELPSKDNITEQLNT